MSIKRALICAPSMPDFDRQGGSKRTFNFIEYLCEAGWAVSFVAEKGNNDDRYARILRQRGVATYCGFDSRVDQLVTAGRFDLALFAFWNIAEAFIPKFRSRSPSTRIMVDTIDLHFLRNARLHFRKPSNHQTAAGLDAGYGSEMMREMNAYAAADGVLAVSEKEAQLINDLVGDLTLAHSVPDSEDLPASEVGFADRRGILFVGNFLHAPNREAFAYLCNEIMPCLDKRKMAGHPIYIVGNALEQIRLPERRILGKLHMVGWVPDLLPYLEHALLSVIPLLHGAGTKRKLIQALMAGTPSVSTSIGIEGLNLIDGEHVLVADDPISFADSIHRLVADEHLWERIARQGRKHINASHGREIAKSRFFEVVAAVLNEASGTARTRIPVRDVL